MSVTLTQDQLKQMMEDAVTAAVSALQVAAAAPSELSRSTVKRAERPEIDLGSNEAQWAFFVDEWKCYKRRTSMKPDQVVDELRASCTKELRKTLFNFVGSSNLETVDEDSLLKQIKAAAVIGKNVAVHRKEFYATAQSPAKTL